MGISYLTILGFSQIFMCWEGVNTGAYCGFGKTLPPSIVGIVFTAARIPAALILSSTSLGLDGIWWSLSISSVCKGYPFDFAVLEIPPTQTQRSTRISLPGNHLIKFQSTTAKLSSDVLLSFYFLCIHTNKIFLVFRFMMIWYNKTTSKKWRVTK